MYRARITFFVTGKILVEFWKMSAENLGTDNRLLVKYYNYQSINSYKASQNLVLQVENIVTGKKMPKGKSKVEPWIWLLQKDKIPMMFGSHFN